MPLASSRPAALLGHFADVATPARRVGSLVGLTTGLGALGATLVSRRSETYGTAGGTARPVVLLIAAFHLAAVALFRVAASARASAVAAEAAAAAAAVETGDAKTPPPFA